jgi:hypothetical protein
MKTIAFLSLASAAISLAAQAQTSGAQVFFSDKAVGVSVLDANGAKLVGANYSAELFYGPLGSDASSFTGLYSSISPFYAVAARAGQWNGGTVNKSFPSSVAQGVAISVQVRVWDSSLFTSWLAYAVEMADYIENPAGLALGTYYQGGASPIFSFTPPTDAGLLTPGSANLQGLRPFSLIMTSTFVDCPEPSMVCLVVLGVGAFIGFRRSSGF